MKLQRAIWVITVMAATVYAGDFTMAPDGKYVGGDEAIMTPDGKFIGDGD